MVNDNLAKEEQITPTDNESVGEWFRDARKAKHLTIEEVAKELRLKSDIIRAIEEHDVEKLPSSTYLFGYVRNYARMLGLSPNDAVRRYENIDLNKGELIAKALQNPRKPVESSSHFSFGKPVLAVVLLIVLVAAGFMIFQKFDLKEIIALTKSGSRQQTSSGSDAVKREIILPPAKTENETQSPQQQAISTQPETVPDTSAETMSEPETPAVVAETSPPQQEQITAPAVAKNTVRLEYTEDSWTEIKDANGKRLMFDLVKAGTKKEINGDMPISIVLGNARGVKVIYHNEVFDTSPYLQGNMAYFTLK